MHPFDYLQINVSNGESVILLISYRDREDKKHFGHSPGVPGSYVKPYVRSKGMKFEITREKRRSQRIQNLIIFFFQRNIEIFFKEKIFL